MFEFTARLFDTDGFTPRANDGDGWTPALIWVHVGGDLFVWLASLSVPLVLLALTRDRREPPTRLFLPLALVLLALGVGHFLEALMFRYPLYRLSAAWKVVTAVGAWAFVVALLVAIQRALHAAPAAVPPSAAPADTGLHRPSGRAGVNDYAVGILAAVLALLLRAAIDPLVGGDHFFILPLLAVVFVSWHSGFGPAVVTLLLTTAGMVYFFIEPVRSFGLDQLSNQLATAVYFFCGVFCAALGEAQRRARKASREALAVALEQKDALAAEVARRRDAEEAGRESEGRFRGMADGAPALVWLADADRRRTYFNRTWLQFTGRPAEKELGDGWVDNVHPEDRDRYLEAYAAAVAAREPFEVEYRLRRHDGEYRWVLARGTPRLTPAGAFAGFIGLCLDVTDRRRAEEDLRRSERNLSEFFENANIGLLWAGRNGTILRANRAELDMLGYARKEYVGHNVAEFHADAGAIADILARIQRGEQLDNYPARMRHKDGTLRDVLISSSGLWEDGRLVHSRCFTRDVTELKHAERSLRASEERFRTLTEAIPQIVWNADREGEVTYLNQRWLDYTGEPLDKARGRGWMDAVHPDDRGRVFAAWRDTVDRVGAAGGDRFVQELRLRQGETGDYRWFLTVAVPLRQPDGSIDQWIGSMADIHETKMAAEAVRAAAERFRTLTEAVPQIVWTADAAGALTFLNRRWEEYTGLPADGLATTWDAVHPEDVEGLRAAWQQALAAQPDRFGHEFRLRRGSDGAYRWMLATAVPLRDAAGGVSEWVGSITDIDDQKRYAETLERTVRSRTAALVEQVEERARAESEVRKQREFLDAILENVTDAIVACDEAGAITLFNRAAHDLYGLPPGRGSRGYELFGPDGVTPLPPQETPLFRALRGERVRDAEVVVAPRERPPRFVLSSGQRLTDADGRNLGAVVSMHDVTEQREAEGQLRRANEELERSNGELEQFAYVASHDLQEPLRKIQAFGDRLTKRFREHIPGDGREYVDRMLASASRMRRLIDDLLSFSRVTTQARAFVPVDLGRLVREVAADLSDRVEQTGGEVRVGELPAVEADPTQMRQLFQNLIANALKFHRPGVPPVVEVSAQLGSEALTNGEPVPVCRVTVRDNGIGFDEKYLDRIFQMFQRLHGREAYEGTGVGLAICRKITERHGGGITARSRPGGGAAFVVTLPIHHPQAPDAPPVEPGG